MAFRKIKVTNLDSNDSKFQDPLLILNQGSSEDVDIGFLSKRGVSNYSGLVRDSATSKFILIDQITLLSNALNDIDAVDGSLVKGTLEANVIEANTVSTTTPTGLVHTTNLITGNIGYWTADPTEPSKHILTVGDDVTPSEYIGNSTGLHTGNVIGELTGNVTGNLIGNVTGTVSDISNHGIQSLSDVDSTDTSATGDMLLYDGSQWGFVNYEDEINTRITANNNSLTATSLSDIGFTGDTVANGDFLLYDSGTGKFGFVDFASEINSYITSNNSSLTLTGLPDVGHTSDTVDNGDFLLYDSGAGKFGYVNFASEVNAYADARIAATNSSHVAFGDSISATAFEGKLYDTNGNVIMDNTSGNVGFGGKTASFDVFDGDLHGEIIHPTTGAKVLDMQYSTPIYTGNVIGILEGVIYNSNGNPVLDNGSISGTPNFGGNVSGDIDSNGASTFSGSVDFTGATITGLPADLSSKTTDDLTEGTTRKYYTDARVDARIATSFVLPKGTTAQRPASPVEGQMYFNTETRMFEGWDGLDWQQLVPSQFQSTP